MAVVAGFSSIWTPGFRGGMLLTKIMHMLNPKTFVCREEPHPSRCVPVWNKNPVMCSIVVDAMIQRKNYDLSTGNLHVAGRRKTFGQQSEITGSRKELLNIQQKPIRQCHFRRQKPRFSLRSQKHYSSCWLPRWRRRVIIIVTQGKSRHTQPGFRWLRFCRSFLCLLLFISIFNSFFT